MHFRVLPTDERFQALLPEAQELLFHIFLTTPTEPSEVAAFKQHMLQYQPLEANEQVRKVAQSMGIDLDTALHAIKGG